MAYLLYTSYPYGFSFSNAPEDRPLIAVEADQIISLELRKVESDNPAGGPGYYLVLRAPQIDRGAGCVPSLRHSYVVGVFDRAAFEQYKNTEEERLQTSDDIMLDITTPLDETQQQQFDEAIVAHLHAHMKQDYSPIQLGSFPPDRVLHLIREALHDAFHAYSDEYKDLWALRQVILHMFQDCPGNLRVDCYPRTLSVEWMLEYDDEQGEQRRWFIPWRDLMFALACPEQSLESDMFEGSDGEHKREFVADLRLLYQQTKQQFDSTVHEARGAYIKRYFTRLEARGFDVWAMERYQAELERWQSARRRDWIRADLAQVLSAASSSFGLDLDALAAQDAAAAALSTVQPQALDTIMEHAEQMRASGDYDGLPDASHLFSASDDADD